MKRLQTDADPCAAGRKRAASLTHAPGRTCSDRSRRRAQRATTDDEAQLHVRPRALLRRIAAHARCVDRPGAADQTPSSRFLEGHSQANPTGVACCLFTLYGMYCVV